MSSLKAIQKFLNHIANFNSTSYSYWHQIPPQQQSNTFFCNRVTYVMQKENFSERQLSILFLSETTAEEG